MNNLAWLESRRNHVGASDVPSLFGLDPFKSKLDTYLSKVGPFEPQEETDAQRLGHLLEPVIASLYGHRTGRPIAQTQVSREVGHGIPLAATLDGLTECGRIVEFKSLSLRNRAYCDQLGEEGTDQIPDAWILQLHAQMACAYATEADLAVLVGGADFKIYTVQRRDDLAHLVAEAADDFWSGHVEPRVPPPAERATDSRALAMLYPSADGEVELPADLADLATAFEEAGAAARFSEKLRDEAKAKLLAALGPAEWGVLPDGRRLRRQQIQVKAREARAVDASSYIKFSIQKAR